ncbi:unnamed protein product [Brassica rapa]|uniref:Oxidoreductase-like domain-containing protein n=1 Tax=Brassica campestris TaxID=3711 RepID=A0A3P6AJZ4_BRACM|nr:unnamed protein product [Brassica rapa]VDC85560.1 unnamed protein product [Brassica rapa]
MVLFHHHGLHLHPRISITTSPGYNRLRKSLNDVLLSMRFGLTRDLRLKRPSFAYYSGSRGQQPITMATKGDKTSTEVKDKVVEEKKDMDKDKKEEVSLPPPPEKPEAGDCCGSGCVRCVWDVYYDELEEYNKLTASTPGDTKSN